MENIIIAGGGIAGLVSAICLSKLNCHILVIERDQEKDERLNNVNIFESWKRKGVPQFKHNHTYLLSMYKFFSNEHPELVSEFKKHGVNLYHINEMLPAELRSKLIRKTDTDLDMKKINCRRPTLESLLYDYAKSISSINILHNVKVINVLGECNGSSIDVRGVVTIVDGEKKEFLGSVIDAMGQSSKFVSWLEKMTDKPFLKDEQLCNTIYISRHYRLRNGQSELLFKGNRNYSYGTDLGYIRFNLFPNEKGYFSICILIHEREKELFDALKMPELFHKACLSIPEIAPWLESDKSVPVSEPLYFRGMKNRWNIFVENGSLRVKNFYAVGDSHVMTNPWAGKGCAYAMHQAQLLRQSFEKYTDLKMRANFFYQTTLNHLGNIFVMLKKESDYFNELAESDYVNFENNVNLQVLNKKEQGLKYWFLSSYWLAYKVAVMSNPFLMRRIIEENHLIKGYNTHLREIGTVIKVLMYMFKGKRNNLQKVKKKLNGPNKSELSRLLDIKQN
ncbi:hypothetical protein [Aliikangiella maris]|uniref:Uncharacterized protein n=2 Tax=Aliikangiella maris TaxID=3162458 RepID=A0ABV3MS30_9GAMM